jgi:phosphocarrier protein
VYSRTVTIVDPTGLHLRSASLLVETAKRFQADVRVAREGQAVDARSAVGLMLLEAVGGTAITITAEGVDEVAAVTALVELVESGFTA